MLNFIFINRYKIGVALIFAGVGGITIGVIIAHFAGFPEGEVIDYFNWMQLNVDANIVSCPHFLGNIR